MLVYNINFIYNTDFKCFSHMTTVKTTEMANFTANKEENFVCETHVSSDNICIRSNIGHTPD